MVGETGTSGGVVAVVPAAGSGVRLAAGIPKAFYQLEGQTLVERAVVGLLDSGVVDAVLVAVPADLTDHAKRILGSKATVVAGGAQPFPVREPGPGGVTRGCGLRARARRSAGADTP